MVNKLLSKLTSGIYALLAILVPKRFKRLVLLSTLYHVAAEQKVFEHLDYERLNQSQQLATNCAAIASAVTLKDAVWDGVDFNELIRDSITVSHTDGLTVSEKMELDEARSVTAKIVGLTPSWLRYDNSEMFKDILMVFSVEPVSVKA